MWGTRRSKSPDRIIAEMTALAKRFGIFHFSLSDSAANGHPRQFEELLDLLIDLDERFTWSANMIAHRGFDRALARKMRQAGCIRAEIGVESGSSRVLHLMHKGARVADNERTLDALKNAGVESVVFLLVGFPGETEEDFVATLNFLEKNRTNIDLVRSANALTLRGGRRCFRRGGKHRIRATSEHAAVASAMDAPVRQYRRRCAGSGLGASRRSLTDSGSLRGSRRAVRTNSKRSSILQAYVESSCAQHRRL